MQSTLQAAQIRKMSVGVKASCRWQLAVVLLIHSAESLPVYSRTYEMRFRACDTIIFLDYPFDVCMNGIKERVGKNRTDIPWAAQTLDPELVKLVERYEIDNRPVILSLLEKYSDGNRFIFRSRLEAAEWMRRLA